MSEQTLEKKISHQELGISLSRSGIIGRDGPSVTHMVDYISVDLRGNSFELLGNYKIEKSGERRVNDILVFYDTTDPNQLEQALKLKEFLDEAKIPYRENLGVREAVLKTHEYAQKLLAQAALLLKYVKEEKRF